MKKKRHSIKSAYPFDLKAIRISAASLEFLCQQLESAVSTILFAERANVLVTFIVEGAVYTVFSAGDSA
jgi:hypothetical protein